MRNFVVCFLLTVLGLTASANNMSAAQDDPYSTKFIRGLLNQPSGINTSFAEKQVERMGDRISVGLIKAIDSNDLSNPAMVKRMVPLIRAAFSFPHLIERDEDKRPGITLVLLAHIRERVHDSELRKAVSEAEAWVRDHAAPNSR